MPRCYLLVILEPAGKHPAPGGCRNPDRVQADEDSKGNEEDEDHDGEGNQDVEEQNSENDKEDEGPSTGTEQYGSREASVAQSSGSVAVW